MKEYANLLDDEPEQPSSIFGLQRTERKRNIMVIDDPNLT